MKDKISTDDFKVNLLLGTDEYIIWKGKPGLGNLFSTVDLWLCLAGTFLVILSALCWFGFYISEYIVGLFCVLSIIFFLIGVYYLFVRFMIEIFVRWNTIYVLTNHKLYFIRFGIIKSIPNKTVETAIVFEHRNENQSIYFDMINSDVFFRMAGKGHQYFCLLNIPEGDRVLKLMRERCLYDQINQKEEIQEPQQEIIDYDFSKLYRLKQHFKENEIQKRYYFNSEYYRGELPIPRYLRMTKMLDGDSYIGNVSTSEEPLWNDALSYFSLTSYPYDMIHQHGFLHLGIHIWLYRIIDNEIYVLLKQNVALDLFHPYEYESSISQHYPYGVEKPMFLYQRLKMELGVEDVELYYAGYVEKYEENMLGKYTWRDNEVHSIYFGKCNREINDFVVDPQYGRDVKWVKLDSLYYSDGRKAANANVNPHEIFKLEDRIKMHIKMDI